MEKTWKEILEKEYADCQKTVSELSQSDLESVPLIHSKKQMYDFDAITEKMSGSKQEKPASVDAIDVQGKKIILTEFKTGFNKVISEKQVDNRKMTCPENPAKVCQPYKTLWVKYNKEYVSQLKDSLKMKAVESYVTLLYHVPDFESYQLYLNIVLDAPNDQEEDILCQLGNVMPKENNVYTNVRSAMNRFKKKNKRKYYYDDIRICSAEDFQKLAE